jgi:serine/threonine protein kinase
MVLPRPRRLSGIDLAPAEPDTSELGATMTSGGVQISKTRGLTVDGNRHGAITREDLKFAPGALGAGACSTVRLARHRRTDERYAVKLFAIFDENKRRQLVEEIRALFCLDCAALVQFHGAYLDGATGKVGVVLDFMDGGSVEGLIQERRSLRASPGDPFGGALPEHACAAILYQCCWGLGYLHFERRLHRDVKPGNILLSSRGEVRLSDFGISKALTDEEESAKTMVGTFRYMAPERLRGAAYAFESDVWAAGMVLLELLRGDDVFPPACTPLDLNGACERLARDFVAEKLDGIAVSRDAVDFAEACLRRRADDRALPDALLGGPWLAGATLGGCCATLAPVLATHARAVAAARPPAPERASSTFAADLSLIQTLDASSDDEGDEATVEG